MNQLDARLQVYEATPEYAKNNPKFSVNNFTGFFYQIHLTGKVDKAYGIEQGKFTLKIPIKPKEKSRIGKIQTRGLCDGCFYDDPTAGFVKRAICWLCDKFAISNSGDTGIDPITSTDPFGFSGYGQTPTIDIDYGENTSVGSTGSGNPLGTGGNSLGTEFDDSIFNDPSYQQKIKEDYVLLTLNPTGVERQFLADNRALFDQFYSFLSQQGDYLEKISTATQHLKLLMENTAYFSANQQAGFPQIGTDAWVNATWTLAEGWGSLNSEEKRLAKEHPKEFISYALSSREAITVTRERFPENQNNLPGNDRNKANAFQHSYWNAFLTLKLGYDRTKVWTDAHEFGSNDIIASEMDFWNNEQGRKVGVTWIANPQGLGMTLADLVQNWINSGQIKYICFDSSYIIASGAHVYIKQRLKFTNQGC